MRKGLLVFVLAVITVGLLWLFYHPVGQAQIPAVHEPALGLANTDSREIGFRTTNVGCENQRIVIDIRVVSLTRNQIGDELVVKVILISPNKPEVTEIVGDQFFLYQVGQVIKFRSPPLIKPDEQDEYKMTISYQVKGAHQPQILYPRLPAYSCTIGKTA